MTSRARLTVYVILWRNPDENTIRQALPSRIAARNRADALQVLADTLLGAGIEDMPNDVTVRWTDSQETGEPRVLAWKAVGLR